MNAIQTQHGTVYELDASELPRLLDEAAQDRLGISGEEFLRQWKAGEVVDTPATIHVAMFLPEDAWATPVT